MKKSLLLIPAFALVLGCSGSDTNSPSNTPSAPRSSEPAKTDTNKPAEANAPEAPVAKAEKKKYLGDPSLEQPQFLPPADGEEVAVIETKLGKIVFKFRDDLAPKHVINFKNIANKGAYDKTLFHRVIPDFMIQGGDPNTLPGKDPSGYGQGGPGYQVNSEFNNLHHCRGVISMARSQDPNSAGSQFFVCVADSASCSGLDRQYTAFGEVVKGIEVAEQIVAQPRNASDLPNERIEMTVKIQKWPIK
jgi:peptidyl-prolyl cis-trans isomerase B (cyclophilin B)